VRSLAIRTLVLCVLAVLAHPAAALAAGPTLYVDRANANCTDSGPGTADQPFCTIGAAASTTTPGTTVLVSAGTYAEQVAPKSGAAGSPVTFVAEPGETVTVTGNGRGFSLSNRTWVTIERFNINNTTGDGLYVTNSSFIKLIGNHVSDAGSPSSGQTARGITLNKTTDSLVSNNVVDHNTDYGVYVVSGSTRNEIVGNQLSFNARQFTRAASGIRLHSSPSNTISSNVSHHNEDSGIELITGSNNTLVVNNVSYENGDHGIDILDSDNQRIVSNSVYESATSGINLEGGSTGGRLSNNISVDNGIASPRTRGNIRVDSASTSGAMIDYDLVKLRTVDTMIVWGGTSYTTLAAFVAATGQEAHGIEADPRWAAPSSGDLHLISGSPAIDSANSGASGESATDVEGLPRADDPGTPNTGVGPRAYDDRGAHEFQGGSDAPPVAALTVTPASGAAPLPVTADASASTDDHGIVSYRFDFGDGSPVVGPQPGATATHTYGAAGTFTVTVTVTDTANNSSEATRQVVVTAGDDAPPVAALTVTPASGAAPLPVTADASASTDDHGIVSYRFDFGDGSPVVGPQPGATATHTYGAAGTFTVTVTVTDTAGQSSTATDQVLVSANLVGNPGFETSLSGWNTSGSGAGITLARVAGGHTGGWAAKLTNTGAAASTCALNDSPDWARPTSAGTYTGTIWVRADTPGATLRLRFREYSGSTLVGTATTLATLTTTWQQVGVTHMTVAPGSSLDFNAYVSGAAVGTCFYADDASILLG
jgi:parallel beta-helix repeat protein